MKGHAVAIDLGSSSGRLISAFLNRNKIELKEQYRFTNRPVQVLDDLYWDYLKIIQEIKHGLFATHRNSGNFDSISVDTWGVDYAFIGRSGRPLLAPHSYRDSRTKQVKAEFFSHLPAQDFFMETGTQPGHNVSALQLFADISNEPFLKTESKHILFMSDLFAYFLSGKIHHEFTMASTSGLLNSEMSTWSDQIFDTMGFNKDWFSNELEKNGQVLGPLLPSVGRDLNLPESIQVVSGIGHSSAAAVLATPFSPGHETESAFISCGTSSIVGTLTDKPVITYEAFASGLTNEGCFGGQNLLLKSVTGLWVMQELQREWSLKGEALSFAKMAELAAENRIGSVINTNDAAFTMPNNMEEKIRYYCSRSGQRVPATHGEVIRVVLQSMALSYRQVISQLETATGRTINSIHMIGGGVQNQLLCQLTASLTKREVIAGPIEASVIGNALAQFIVLGKLKRKAVTSIIVSSFRVTHYHADPREEESGDYLYQRYLELTQKKSVL